MAIDAKVQTINGDLNLNLKIEIQNGNKGFLPEVVGSVVFTTERKNRPGQLVFSVLMDAQLQIEEGNPVKLTVRNKCLFYGFIFTISRTKSRVVRITAYDQIRYLLNKDTYVFKNATAAAIIKMIAADYGLRVGNIEETAYTIPGRVMDNKTLLDMMQDALEITLTNKRTLFCLYDKAGELTLEQSANMKVGLIVDADSAEDFSYSSTIDNGVYNVVKLVYEESDDDGEKTGQRKVFVAQDKNTQKKWGTLQYFENISDTANAQNKAKTLLDLYNTKNKALTVRNVTGDLRVRAGSMVMVQMNFDDISLQNWMLVETCTHTFQSNRHTMTLKLRGGEFVG